VGVAEFTRDESVALLRAIAPSLSEMDADRVAAAVGDLPLVVDQAGSLLADAGMDVETYLQLLRERTADLLDQDTGGAYPLSTAASWGVAFDRLAADGPAALELLTLVAWCAPEPVPLILLTDHPDTLPDRLAGTVGDPLALARCMQVLHRRAMATLTPHSIQLHRVPAALLRARTGGVDSARPSWPGRVLRLLASALRGEVWDNPPVWPLWQQLLPHVLAAVHPERPLDDVAYELVWLLVRAATYRHTRGEPRVALPLFRRAYSTSRARFGDDHPRTLFCANNLALDLWDLGQHEEARELNEDTLLRRRRLLGDDHPDTLLSASNLVLPLLGLGQYEQGRRLNEDTLARRRQVLGEDDLDTLTSAHNLASILSELGQHEQSRALEEDTLARRRRVLGDDHPHTLISASHLATDLRALGQHQRAHDLDEDTLTRRRRVLGDDHPHTLISASHLATDLRALGQHQRAHDLDEDTLTRRRRVLGDNHPGTLTTANNLAADLHALGKHQQARAMEEWIGARQATSGSASDQ
jgi:hypothetical protein